MGGAGVEDAVSFHKNFDQKRRERGRAHHVFTIFLSLCMTREEMVMRRSGEARRELATIEVLLVCLLACLYVFEFPLPLLLFLLSYFLSHL
jgi:hypothetical protein